MNEKKKALLQKLKALAERGMGGEKEGAERKLKQLMAKYGENLSTGFSHKLYTVSGTTKKGNFSADTGRDPKAFSLRNAQRPRKYRSGSNLSFTGIC